MEDNFVKQQQSFENLFNSPLFQQQSGAQVQRNYGWGELFDDAILPPKQRNSANRANPALQLRDQVGGSLWNDFN